MGKQNSLSACGKLVWQQVSDFYEYTVTESGFLRGVVEGQVKICVILRNWIFKNDLVHPGLEEEMTYLCPPLKEESTSKKFVCHSISQFNKIN